MASNNDDTDACPGGSTLESKVDFTATAGVNYWIAVDEEGNVELTVVGPGAPTPPTPTPTPTPMPTPTPTPPPPPADTSAPGGDLKAKGSQKAGKATKIKVGPLNEAGRRARPAK